MLNCPRVTCSSRASMLAFCWKRKLVMRATTPERSRPITVRIAKSFIVNAVAASLSDSCLIDNVDLGSFPDEQIVRGLVKEFLTTDGHRCTRIRY